MCSCSLASHRKVKRQVNTSQLYLRVRSSHVGIIPELKVKPMLNTSTFQLHLVRARTLS